MHSSFILTLTALQSMTSQTTLEMSFHQKPMKLIRKEKKGLRLLAST